MSYVISNNVNERTFLECVKKIKRSNEVRLIAYAKLYSSKRLWTAGMEIWVEGSVWCLIRGGAKEIKILSWGEGEREIERAYCYNNMILSLVPVHVPALAAAHHAQRSSTSCRRGARRQLAQGSNIKCFYVWLSQTRSEYICVVSTIWMVNARVFCWDEHVSSWECVGSVVRRARVAHATSRARFFITKTRSMCKESPNSW